MRAFGSLLLKKMPPTPVILPSGSAETDMGVSMAKTATDSNLRLADTALAPSRLLVGCYGRVYHLATVFPINHRETDIGLGQSFATAGPTPLKKTPKPKERSGCVRQEPGHLLYI